MMRQVDKRFGARFTAVAMSALILIPVSGCALQRHQDTLQVLGDITAGTGDSRLKQKTLHPSRETVRYSIDSRPHAGDLYLPGNLAADAGIVLVPGAVPEGKDHPSLVQLAYTLARARFAVFVPDLTGYRKLKVGPADIREVADAFRYLAARDELPEQAGVGIGAFSYAVGPAVLAALEEDIREQVQFILGIGGYYDMRKSIRFITTGYYEHKGKLRHLQASEYGKLVFARSVMDQLDDPADRNIIDAMVEARLADQHADLSGLAEELGPEGRTVHDLLVNTDPTRTFDLIAGLPARVQAIVAALSVHDKDLSRLRARLILVHGRNDLLIPFPESAALAAAAPRARLFILNHILGHVDLSPSHMLTWRFWTRELPDAWRLYRAAGLLMKQREIPCGARTSQPGIPPSAEVKPGCSTGTQYAERTVFPQPAVPVRDHLASADFDHSFTQARWRPSPDTCEPHGRLDFVCRVRYVWID
ncbi:MAG TPA: hypothetical protein VMP00_09085 [Burkholderiales bacterium]|nr:hypothetical protein [Burkholderiales bacterium]